MRPVVCVAFANAGLLRLRELVPGAHGFDGEPFDATSFSPPPEPPAVLQMLSLLLDLQKPSVLPAGLTHSCGSPGGLRPDASFAASLAI